MARRSRPRRPLPPPVNSTNWKDLPGSQKLAGRRQPPEVGSRFYQPALASTLTQLCRRGSFESFLLSWSAGGASGPWDGDARLAQYYAGDLNAHVARRTTPLKLAHQQGEVWNLAPPTQGLVSLAILGITDRLAMADADDAGTVHRIVEATKLALACAMPITDPRELKTDIQSLRILRRFRRSPTADDNPCRAGHRQGPGDTVDGGNG
ncbi:gamma-glutamyltransferase [Enterobacter cloacae subsp. cloacae]|nr:gamma-glutamyltransferase [Enterobacter cloacae subsp. cloacae]